MERAAFAEAFIGLLSIHIFYAVKAGNAVAPLTPAADAAVPVWHDRFAFPADKLGQTFQFGKDRGPMVMQITVTPDIGAVARLIDGKTPLGEIRRRSGLPRERFDAAFAVLWRLNGLYYLFLRL